MFAYISLILNCTAHNGHNGTTTAAKQTKAAVKTDNGVAVGQKTTIGRRFRS